MNGPNYSPAGHSVETTLPHVRVLRVRGPLLPSTVRRAMATVALHAGASVTEWTVHELDRCPPNEINALLRRELPLIPDCNDRLTCRIVPCRDDECVLLLSLPPSPTDIWLSGLIFPSLLAGIAPAALAWPVRLAAPPATEAIGPPAWPIDYRLPEASRARFAVLDIGNELSGRLRALAAARAVSFDALLTAGLLTLLHRYTNEKAVNLHVPASAGTLDHATTTVRISADFEDNPNFSSILAHTSRQLESGAASARGAPLLFAGCHKSGTSEGLLALALGVPGMSVRLGELVFEGVEVGTPNGEFERAFFGIAADAGLRLAVVQGSGLSDLPIAERMLEHFQVLLNDVAARPEAPIGTLRIMSEPERRKALVDWNRTGAPYPTDRCMHSLIAERTATDPNAIAAAHYSLLDPPSVATLTYGELDRRANRLANRLRRLGVGSETFVALYMERSLELVVAVLGVLRAGGAYLPLDPNYPTERLAYMLRDADVQVVLTQRKLRDRLPTGERAVLVLDLLRRDLQIESDECPGADATPESPAYLIYTSGSTGRPKGVVIRHRSLVNEICALRRTLPFGERDAFVLNSSLSFDVSVAELFLPLAAGGRVVMADQAETADAEKLMQLVSRSGATFLQATPSVWRFLLAAGWRGAPTLTAVCAGEVLPSQIAAELRARTGRVWNLYGPTETTIYATGCPVLDATGPNSIGHPLDNVRAYILDVYGQPVPIGVWGELFIGGVNLARGYHKQPALTAERFTADPFAPGNDERRYQTGDVARYRSDGQIELRGRADNQIKIRGLRIEIGEIESVLAEHPGVSEVAVIVRENTDGEGQLIAYIVFAGAVALGTNEMREYLLRRLIAPMIPSAFVAVRSLPLTPSGKLDRKALPEPPAAHALAEHDLVEPQSDTAGALAGIWSRVFAREYIGGDDSFFDLGGHSLLAMQIISRVRDVFDKELLIRDVFDHPTVTRLAAHIDRLQSQGLRPPATTTRPPLSFAQQRIWFLSQLDPDSPLYVINAKLRLRGRLDVTRLERSLGAVQERHDSLRTIFPRRDGVPTAVVLPPLCPTLGPMDLRALAPERQVEEVGRIMATERTRSFDLERGPLVRSLLIQVADDEYVLLLTMHHIAADGWSVAILVRELTEIYDSLTAGRPPRLAPLPLSYGDLAAQECAALTSGRVTALVEFWKTQLDGCPTTLELNTDRPRAAIQDFRGAKLSADLGVPLTRSVRRLAQEQATTPFVVLLSAFHALLHRYTGMSDIIVGAPVATRTRTASEPLIGLFLNTLPLRSSDLGEITFRALVRQLRDRVLSACDHQDLPIEILIRALRLERDASRPPLFQAFFNILNFPRATAAAAGLTIDVDDMVEGTARFDLSLYAVEQADSVAIHLVYAAELFHAATAAQFLRHFTNLLRAAVADPDQRLVSLPLLNAEDRAVAERHAQTLRPNRPLTAFPQADTGQSIGRHFGNIARQHPRRIAVRDRTGTVGYRELDRASDHLAGVLARGDDRRPVALLFGHDQAMVVGILAALKAGRPYVPLDPFHPVSRIAAMLANSGASALVTNTEFRETAEHIASSAELPVIDLGDAQAATGPLPEISADAVAYILYTSGSTGTPKGVVQSHRNVLAHIRNYTNNLGIGPDDRLSLISSYSFDAAVMDIFGALLNGATLCLIDVRSDGLLRLAESLVDNEVTIYHSTPTVFRYLTEALPQATHFERIRFVILGGEAATSSDFERFRRYFSVDALLVNGLGPTESTLALQHFMTPATSVAQESLPVGYPVDGAEVLLLNPSGTDNEVYGEIAIRSPHVALGYWRNPELTTRAFSTDPGDGARRIYRTGDIGRRLSDGSIIFLGRRDDQVKLRGHRIELGEVEAVLGRMPGVRQVVATIQHDSDLREPCLAAYLLPHPEAAPLMATIRSFAMEHLPSYMVPSRFVRVDSLPVTPTGKIDRQALTRLPPIDIRAAAPHPTRRQSDREREIAAIWQGILAGGPAAADSNFFDLGGHSLLLARVQAELERHFGIAVPLVKLFQYPTVGTLAEYLDRRSSERVDDTQSNDLRERLMLRAQARARSRRRQT